MTAASSPACTRFNAQTGCPQNTTTRSTDVDVGSENGSSTGFNLRSQLVDTLTYFKINAMDPVNPFR